MSIGHAQMGGGGMGGGIPGTSFGGATDPSNVPMAGGFRIIPSITVAERYDSNVFFTKKSPGLDRSDYVTRVVPQLRGLYGGEAMTVNATISANGEYYAKNPNFNYIGTNAAMFLDLSPMFSRLWNGMNFRIVDQFRYTPQPPSFLVGNQEGDTSNLLQTGQQVGRVNSTNNTIGANFNAPLTQTLNLLGGYINGFTRFGSSQVQQAGSLLNSSFQTFTVGLSKQVSPQDTVALNFFDSEFRYEQDAGSFSSRGGFVGWTHAFSPAVTLVSAAGINMVDRQSSNPGATGTQEQSSVPSNAQNTITPRANAVLTWRDNTTTLALAYGLTISPSYQFAAQPLLTNFVTFSVTQVTPIPQLLGLASVNYGRGDEIGSNSVNAVSYSSYQATGGFLYSLTPQTFLNLLYQYANYDNQFGATTNSFDRHVVSISIAQAFY